MAESKKDFDRLEYSFSLIGKGSFFLDLDLSRFSHRMIYRETQKNGLYEKETSMLVGAILEKGDTVIDVGAHIGYFSLLSSVMVEDTGAVYSFEPIKENIDHLHHNLKINNMCNVNTEQSAVGNQVGITKFYYNRDNDGGHALWDVGTHPLNIKSKENPCPLELPITSLDEYFASKDLSNLKILKIDTEGNEFNVLKGARNILEKNRIKCIIWELNRSGLEQMGDTEDDIRAFMSELGYETLVFLNGELTVMEPHQRVDKDYIINQFFMPRELVKG